MILIASAGLAAIVVIALVFGSLRWKSETTAMRARLEAARRPFAGNTFSLEELDGLPPVVQKYFRAALKDGQPLVSAVTIEQSGTINMSATGENWKPFTATQRVIALRPGFDWEARIGMMPGLAARVHDAYIAGEGILHASLFGLVTVANLRGTADLAEGELLRFFAETAWYPTALLPSQGVEWKAIDDSSAQATLKDGSATVTLLFRFDESGLVASMLAAARGRLVAGTAIPTPWEGRWSRYELREGMRIPIEGEVAWLFPDGPKTYWRGRITGIRFEFAAAAR
jgi:hypothetical protein